ncbi:uncharacterized protein LOC124925276 [Impatiens glandulifera]|uniref:uncharacterized protein LOC124925276 n=1 Tax=Impatiens glandulifera TaxID=253017 RepID=UPI001FB0823B|nr:uncharacterized protein LOC124925276 [Impatiens glandulifera]
MNLCVNCKSGTSFLGSIEESMEAHTGIYIFEYVEKYINEIGPQHVVQVVTDNATNNMAATELLKFSGVLEKAKALTIFIYAHHRTLAIMRKYTKKKDIVRPGVTRFATSFLTLESLKGKKDQLRLMFTSDEWSKTKLRTTVKGKAAEATVTSISFWNGVSLALNVFTPLVKVLRLVDGDKIPSMAFLFGALKQAKEEVKQNFKKEENDIPILKIVDTKSKVYKNKSGNFSRKMAIAAYEKVNVYHDFDPVGWWSNYGGDTPNLQRMAMRFLSLTSSSSGCERNWSQFEGIHTKKRNRLETSRLNDLVYVKFNANLMKKKSKRETGGDLLLCSQASEAQDWLVEGGDEDEVEPGSGLTWKMVAEASGADEVLRPRRSERRITIRELDEDLDTSEEEHEENVDFESDDERIMNVADGAYIEDLED